MDWKKEACIYHALEKTKIFAKNEVGINKMVSTKLTAIYTAQKMKISIKDFFSKCDQICRKLQIWSYLLKKSLMENLSFWCSLYCSASYIFKINKGTSRIYSKVQLNEVSRWRASSSMMKSIDRGRYLSILSWSKCLSLESSFLLLFKTMNLWGNF